MLAVKHIELTQFFIKFISDFQPFSVTFVNEKAWDRYVQDAVRMVQVGLEITPEGDNV